MTKQNKLTRLFISFVDIRAVSISFVDISDVRKYIYYCVEEIPRQ